MGRLPGSWDPPAWGSPWKGLLLAASVLGSCLQPAPAQTPVSIVLTPPSPVVGRNVSLAPHNPPQDFTSCNWYRSATTDENSRILTYFPGPPPVQQNSPNHTGRETAGPGCALTIAGLTLNDTGSYTVKIDSPTSSGLGSVYLRVSEGVSGVNITISPSVPIEPEAVTLSCEARGSPVSYSWFKDNEILEAGSRVLLSSDNQTLTLDPSSRNDSGSYTCLATNTVSSQNATVRLDVLYGPNTPSITPRQEVYAEGSTLRLSCRADASPAAVFIWLFNGAPLASFGSDLLVPSLSVSQSGTYTCVVIILFAGRSSYTTLEIAVLEMLPRPTVTPNQTQVPENGTFTLTCNTSPSADTVLWLRDGVSLSDSERLVLSSDNRTLTVLNFTRGDAGAYQCEVRNLVSTNRSEPSNVTLAYGPDSARIEPSDLRAQPLGSLVTLTCVSDSVPAPSYRWFLNSTELKETGSSLTLNLTSLDQQGTYMCQAQNPITSLTKNSTTLVIQVQEMLPRPTVTPNQTQVPENGTFTLTCNTSPSADTVLWLRDGVSLSDSERLVLSSDNRTLTVLNFTRGDAGAYQCEVRNLVSTNRSEPSNVTLAYGPDSARIEPSDLRAQPLGSLVTLTCVSDSVPAPSYRWFLNSTELKETGSSLTLNLTSLDQQGTYMCQAQNPITSLTKNSTTLVIQVQEMLPRPTVTPNQTQVPENGTFTLTCNTSPSADTVLWLRDGASLVPSERLGLSPDNRTLTVLNVTRGEAGTYRCEVRNPVSTNRSEPSNVTVAYGPDSTRIDPPGPIDLSLGSPLTLTCVADSVPAPSYRWVLNGTDTNETGSSLTFNPTTLDHQGTYECQAQNPITNRTAWASVTVRFVESPPKPTSPTGLSPGAIAGIVIGSLAGAALLGGLLYFLLRKTGGGPKQRAPVGGQAAPAHNQGVCDNKPTLGDEDIQYSTLAFAAGNQKPPPGTQPPPESGTVYSEIKKK